MKSLNHKLLLGFLFGSLCVLNPIFSQEENPELEYKTRFYKNGELLTTNLVENDQKEGLWIEYFNTNWRSITKLKRSGFYRLIEYQNGIPINKVYDFYSNGQLQWIGEFESLDPEVLVGVCIWYKRNGDVLHYKNFDIINRYMPDY